MTEQGPHPHDEFNIEALLDPALHEMGQKFSANFVYKYYPEQRRDFFACPRIRFTQKTALNDKFELSKRWREFGGAPVRSYLSTVLKSGLSRKLRDEATWIGQIERKVAETGITPSHEQIAFFINWMKSDQGKVAIAEQELALEPFIEQIFNQLSSEGPKLIDDFISTLGIFSISENPTSEQLWALYASEGRGFVIEFNASHNFFKASKDGAKFSSLHRVTYTDVKIDDFWRNPLYLFAVKSKKWSFEEEWRILKTKKECDYIELINSEEFYFCKVEPGMISSIIFGYDYPSESLASDFSTLRKFDANIQMKKAKINTDEGCIELI